MLENRKKYGFDTDNIFAVGDSAGAHQLALYSCILTNPEYAKTYKFQVPGQFKLRAIALNCGQYDMRHKESMGKMEQGLMKCVLKGKGTEEELQWVTPILHMTSQFPPTYLMTALGDFLHEQVPVIEKQFDKFEIEHVTKMYGTEDNPLSHIFHCNMRSEDAKICNDEECQFFKAHMNKHI